MTSAGIFTQMNTVSGRLRDFVAAAGLEIPGSQLEIYIGSDN